MDPHALTLSNNAEQADQPAKITIPLKPHQKTALARAIKLETREELLYADNDIESDEFLVYAGGNGGIIGDSPGAGKTLMALSIIAASPTHSIYRYNETAKTNEGVSSFFKSRKAHRVTPDEYYIDSTLIIVPHTIFKQWTTALSESTTLKYYAIGDIRDVRALADKESTEEELRQKLSQYDLLVIKRTMLKNLSRTNFPNSGDIFYRWARVMIDEVHEIPKMVRDYEYKFIWGITGTHYMMNERAFGGLEKRFFIVKNDPDFVRQSMEVPNMHPPAVHMCRGMAHTIQLREFLTPEVLEMLHTDNVQGAIEVLGGNVANNDTLASVVLRNLERDVALRMIDLNHARERLAIDNTADNRERIEILTARHQGLSQRLEQFRQRVMSPEYLRNCAICYEDTEMINPVVLGCTHVYCGQCVLAHLRRRTTCPECRQEINPAELVAISSRPPADPAPRPQPSSVMPNKVERICQIIGDNPDGRYLVFNSSTATFDEIKESLRARHRITAEFLRGNSNVIDKHMAKFQSGELRVLLINSTQFAAGMNLQAATDVIIYHKMDDVTREQCISRAHRVGRTAPLRVHYLTYPTENNRP